MVRRIIILIFLLMFTINPQAYAKNFYSNHEKDLETWKESITNCVKEEERDGFWVDIAIDESGSMDSEDPQRKALSATFGLIEELSLKIDKFNALNKEIYFNFYPFSTDITAAYSTGRPATKTELESVTPNSWTYTGGGTDFGKVFYYFLKNSRSGIQNFSWTQSVPLPPTYAVNSKDLNLCHVAIFLTDGGSSGYKDLAEAFLNQEHTYLLTAQIGSEISFVDLKNNISNSQTLGGPNNNAITLKIDDLDEIFTLWEEILDTVEDSIISSIEGAISVADNIEIEICESGTLPRENDKCVYEFSLTAFADTYYITGGALDNSGKSTSIEDLILRITPPDTNIGTEFDLENRDLVSKNIKNVEITVDPSRSKFSIKIDPQKDDKKFREWVGLWTVEILIKDGKNIDGRRGFIDQEITGQVTTYLVGPDSATPYKEVCYQINYRDNSGLIFNSSDYQASEVKFKVQNQNGKELTNIFQYRLTNDSDNHCFTFDDSISGTDIYIKPIVKITTQSKAGEFAFPTISEEKMITVGDTPNSAVLNEFIDKNFEPTANEGELNNGEKSSILTENENTKIFFDCIKEWRADQESYLEPEKSIRFISKDFEASCGDEIVLEKPGTYEFSTIISIDEINKGSGILAYQVEIFDNTFNQKTSLGSAEFKVLIYFVSATSRYLYSTIFLLATGLFTLGMDRLLKLLQKGFAFPSNLRVLTFEVSKNQNIDEFITDFKNIAPFNLPSSRRLKSQSIGSFNFYVKSGLKEVNYVYIKTNSRLLYKNESSELIERINSKEFPNLQLLSINQELKTAEIVIFVDENFSDENFDVTGLYYKAQNLIDIDSQPSDDSNEIFTNKDTNIKELKNNENSNDPSPDTGTDWGDIFE